MPSTEQHKAMLMSSDNPRRRTALETYGSPAGRIQKGAITAELMETFKGYGWAIQILVGGALDGETL